VDYTEKLLPALSFCPGLRGLERGIERVIGKFEVAAYVEIEAFIVSNLVNQMEAGLLAPAPIWTDVKTFNARPFRGKIGLALGGYPCQPFSNAGKRGGINDSRHLWPYLRDIIEIAEPRGCFFENVAGHLSIGYDIVRRELQELGYAVKEGIFSAEEVGATHQRKRLFVLAIKKELANAHRLRYGTRTGDITCASEEIERTTRESYRQWLRYDAWYVGKIMADTNGKRTQISTSGEQSAEQFTKWPAPQGSYQHEWEQPRTIEPRMGCSIDGYNFREDLIRAFGNSVVEQTAELAFRTLMLKHLNV
jgi:DNA (cytosine-5)-methyltransferase 1